MTDEPNRTRIVAFRARPRERHLLGRAAERMGRSLSDLVRDAAKLEALEALARPADDNGHAPERT